MRVEWLPEVDSTNAALAARAAAGEVEHGDVLVTDTQTAGRGRQGRAWVAPPGTSLAISVFVRGPGGLSWLPLLAGLAMTRAVRGILGDDTGRARLKWPNDVLVEGRKVSGILGEIAGDGAVIGAGVNLTIPRDRLPVPTATTLELEGAVAEGLADRALNAYLGEFDSLWGDLEAVGFDPERSLRSAVAEACGTIGQPVRVELPGGAERYGSAIAIDASGRLVVASDEGEFAVAAGDVTHVRPY